MKDELLKIIDFELKDSELKNLVLRYCNDLIDYYEAHRTQTIEKFNNLLNKYNFQTIDKINECPDYPSVTLFKGIDTFTFYPVIDYQGGISETDNEIGVIIEQAEIWIADYSSSEQEQDSLSEYSWNYHGIIIFTWLASIWQEIEGYKYGIVVKTLENNSCSAFIFNDLAWDDLSEYRNYGDRTKAIDKYFNCDLTIFEIYQRVRTITYPVNPYQNKWRVFASSQEMVEIVMYGNETGERKFFLGGDKNNLNVIEHKNLLEAIKYVQKQTENYIEEGFREKQELRSESIYEGAIEVGFHSGVWWYDNELSNRLSIKVVENFENRFRIRLPFYFKHYLRLFNGRKYNEYMKNFYIGENNYLRVAEFYDIDTLVKKMEEIENNEKTNWLNNFLKKKKEQNIEWLEIAKINDNELLIININHNSDEYGNLSVHQTDKKNYNPLNVSFPDFVSKNKY